MPSATAEPTCSANPRRGQDLFDFVDAHPDGLSPEPLQRILAQIADAVCFLHEHSIVHRDIKDENVVLDPEGNVRLIDFGSAAYVREGRKFDTFSGTLECAHFSLLLRSLAPKVDGTTERSFAAPEVLKGARYSGKEQDIWALGVTLYCLLFGDTPFMARTEYELYNVIVREPIRVPLVMGRERAWTGVGQPWEGAGDGTEGREAIDLLGRLLEKDPTQRITLEEVKVSLPLLLQLLILDALANAL